MMLRAKAENRIAAITARFGLQCVRYYTPIEMRCLLMDFDAALNPVSGGSKTVPRMFCQRC